MARCTWNYWRSNPCRSRKPSGFYKANVLPSVQVDGMAAYMLVLNSIAAKETFRYWSAASFCVHDLVDGSKFYVEQGIPRIRAFMTGRSELVLTKLQEKGRVIFGRDSLSRFFRLSGRRLQGSAHRRLFSAMLEAETHPVAFSWTNTASTRPYRLMGTLELTLLLQGSGNRMKRWLLTFTLFSAPSVVRIIPSIIEASRMGGPFCYHGYFSRQNIGQLDILDASKTVQTDCSRLSNILAFIVSNGSREPQPRHQSESGMRQGNRLGICLKKRKITGWEDGPGSHSIGDSKGFSEAAILPIDAESFPSCLTPPSSAIEI